MIIALFSGLLFIISGWIVNHFPPGRINVFYGYRSSRSMSDQATWDVAQRVASKEVIKVGSGLCLLSLLGFLISWLSDMSFTVGLVLVILAVFVMIVRVERRLGDFIEERSKQDQV